MRVRVDGVVRTGRAVDLRPFDVDPCRVVRAVRADGSEASGQHRVTVDCPEPGPVHGDVGLVTPGRTVRIRAALARVARERGLAAPQDDELAAVREELAAVDPPEPELAAAREGLADLDGAALAELREAVAASRGAVQTRLELGADVAPAREALSESAAELASAQTDRVAAEQTLRRERERAREARAVRARRLRLQDRAGNLERAARAHLAGALRDEFAAAVEAVPGEGRVPAEPASFEGDGATAALAVARLAALRAPVVLSWGFRTAARAARVLDAPVVTI